MPLTRKQFELGIDKVMENWMRQIYRYLADYKNQAFSLEEIADAMKVSVGIGDIRESLPGYEDFSAALEKMVEIGVVNEREINGTHYFALGRRSLEEFLEPQN